MTLNIDPNVAIDPATGRPWPRWLNTEQTARFLREVYGLPFEAKTLANQRATGRGPAWHYFGQRPLCGRDEAGRFAEQDALTDESPLTRRARERVARRTARDPEATINA